jgi:beta-glucanase (GH16 family)
MMIRVSALAAISALLLGCGAPSESETVHGIDDSELQPLSKPLPPPPPPTLDYSNYSLVWWDEFNGSALDGSVWTPEIGNGNNGWGNNELEYYTDRTENVRVEGGQLIIEAWQEPEPYEGFNYTSARLKTEGNKAFQYGIIEARIQSPTGSGLWPAFWMLGNDFSSVGWPNSGEIDAMENKGTNTVYQYAHWFDDDKGAQGDSGTTTSADISRFHIFSIRWTESSIEWYIDGVQEHVLDTTPSSMSEFRQPYFLLLNLAVGGNFPGSPRHATAFPAQLVVDWVHVYQ